MTRLPPVPQKIDALIATVEGQLETIMRKAFGMHHLTQLDMADADGAYLAGTLAPRGAEYAQHRT